MLSLIDYINDEQPIYYEKYYESVFKKIDIYNRNTQLIQEGKYTKIPTIIQYTPQEQLAISEMIYAIQFLYLENYLATEANINEEFDEMFYDDPIFEGADTNEGKIRALFSKGKEKIEAFIQKLIDKIPEKIKVFYKALAEIAQKGIKTAKDLIKKIGKILLSLGEKLEDAFEKLGMYRKEVVDDIPDSDMSDETSNNIIDKFTSDTNKLKTNKFIANATYKAFTNKGVRADFSDNKINENRIYESIEDTDILINEGLFEWLGKLFNKIFGFDTEKVLSHSESFDDGFSPQFVSDTSFSSKDDVAKEQMNELGKLIQEQKLKSNKEELEYRKKHANVFIEKNGDKINDNNLKYVISLSKRLKTLGEELKDNDAVELSKKLEETIQTKYKGNEKKIETAQSVIDKVVNKLKKRFKKNVENTNTDKTDDSDAEPKNDESGTEVDGDGKKKHGLGKKLAIGAVTVGALASTTFSLLPIALLVGGFLTFKTLKWIGPKLSSKLEPILLSDKTKAFVNKLYDNKIARFGLSLSKQDVDGVQKKVGIIGKLWKFAKAIVVNCGITYCVASIVGILVSPLFAGPAGAVAVSLIVASIFCVKGIASTMFNRILNFKKETVINGKKVTNHFFDVLTLVSILSSIMGVVLKIPGVKDWFASIFEKLRTTNIKDVVDGISDKFKQFKSEPGYFDNGKFVSSEDMPKPTEVTQPNIETKPVTPENVENNIVVKNDEVKVTDPSTQQTVTVDKTGEIKAVETPKEVPGPKITYQTTKPENFGDIHSTPLGQQIADGKAHLIGHSHNYDMDWLVKAGGGVVNGQKMAGTLTGRLIMGENGEIYMHVIHSKTKDVIVDAVKGNVEVNEVSERIIRFGKGLIDHATYDKFDLYGERADITLINNADYIAERLLESPTTRGFILDALQKSQKFIEVTK